MSHTYRVGKHVFIHDGDNVEIIHPETATRIVVPYASIQRLVQFIGHANNDNSEEG